MYSIPAYDTFIRYHADSFIVQDNSANSKKVFNWDARHKTHIIYSVKKYPNLLSADAAEERVLKLTTGRGFEWQIRNAESTELAVLDSSAPVTGTNIRATNKYDVWGER